MALLAAVSLYAEDLNVYASGLNATTTTNVISATTIDYVLNAPATALNVKLYNGNTLVATVPVTGAAYLTKGAHTNVPVDLKEVASGTYTWAVEAIGAAHVTDIEIGAQNVKGSLIRGMAIDLNTESPRFGTIYTADALSSSVAGGRILAISPDLTTVDTINTTGMWATASTSSPYHMTMGEDGYLYTGDWADNAPNIIRFDPANPTAAGVAVFGGEKIASSGLYANTSGDTIHGSMPGCYVEGTGANRVLYTVDEDFKKGGKLCAFAYNIGEMSTPWTNSPSAVKFTNKAGVFLNSNSNLFTDGHGGFWMAQHRANVDATPAFWHVGANDSVDFKIGQEMVIDGTGYNTQGSLFVTPDKELIVTTSAHIACFWKPYFTGDVLDSCVLVQSVTTDVSGNRCVVVDPAHNVYVFGSTCMWVYAAAGNNTCEIPAPTANTITVTNIEQLYEIGNNQPSGFVPTEGTAMRKVEGNVFVYEGSLPADTYFAFSTVLAANNDDGGWAYLNSHRYGATTNNLDIAYGDSEDLVAGTNTFKMSAAGFYTITVNFNTMKVSVASLPAKVEIMQGWDNWAPVLMTNDDGVTCTATIALEPGDYSGNENGFKVRINDNTTWYGVFDIFKRKMGAAYRTKVLNSANDNAGLWADVPGDYTFTYKYATGEMTISWPESFTRAAEIGDYQTLCVPFTAYVTGAEVYEIKASDIHSGYVTLTAAAAELHAGYSYILKATATTINIYMPGGTVQYEPIQPGGGATGLYGALSVSYLYKYDTESVKAEPWVNNYVLQSDNKFHEVQAGGEVTINSTRAYLHIAGGANAPELRIIEAGNEATNINNVEGQEQAVKFIQDGKLFIQKNGVTYDALGRVVR